MWIVSYRTPGAIKIKAYLQSRKPGRPPWQDGGDGDVAHGAAFRSLAAVGTAVKGQGLLRPMPWIRGEGAAGGRAVE